MASQFYVGQRVKIVRRMRGLNSLEDIREMNLLIGQEATVNEVDCKNQAGGSGLCGLTALGDDTFCLPSYCLEPLTDPGQQEFRAEDILTLENLREGPKRDATMPADMAKAWASDRFA